jgi:hypothetical protein
MWNNITMTSNGWHTNNKGSQIAAANIPSSGTIYFRTTVNVLPSNQQATFQYSINNSTFYNLGNAVTVVNNQVFFMAWRYGIFNFATRAKGGSIVLKTFSINGTMQNSVN